MDNIIDKENNNNNLWLDDENDYEINSDNETYWEEETKEIML